MDSKEFKKIVELAEVFPTMDAEQFSFKAWDLAEAIHKSNRDGTANKFDKIVTTPAHAVALVKWQAMCLNGNWDMQALAEVKEFMAFVTVAGLDEALKEHAPTRRGKSKVCATLGEVEVTVTDDRFGQIEW